MAEESGVHRFANYNIRYVNSSNGDTGEKLWANRRTYVVQNITGFDFDIVGLEEVTGNNKDSVTGKSQLQDLRDMLPDYTDYSVEREGKNYSYNSIFFKKSKYTELERGFFYLNEHPSTPGSGWDGEIPRTCIWLHLADKASGQDFYFVCTHVNYGSTESGIQSAKLIGQRIRALVGQTPMVLVGDFNMDRTNHEKAYSGYASHFYDLALTALVNQCLPAEGPQITATTTEWTPAVRQKTGAEYDYIFYDHMEPLSRHIITEYYPDSGRTVNPSDHYPVLGRFRLQSAHHPTQFRVTDITSLSSALAVATPEDTILMKEGTYTLTQSIVPSCSMTISGGWDASFSAQTGTSHLCVSNTSEAVITIPHYFNLTLDHIEISGADNSSMNGGGAVYSCGSDLMLKDCYIHDNIASTTGGAIVHKGETLSLCSSLFEHNSATTGGAVWCLLRDKLIIRDCRFVGNIAGAAGGALTATAFSVLDIQRSAFISNNAATHGAVDICPTAAPQGVYLLNCSFLNNSLMAKKGLPAVTRLYGGAALWADMTNINVPINIGLCTFMGNHVTFSGTAGNFAGAALAVFKGKLCLMDNLILANDQTVDSAEPAWVDLYTHSTEVNLWRNTSNLTSSSPEINGWQDAITTTFGGTLTHGYYLPMINDNGSYPVLHKSLASYNIACLPANQRLCESAFTYDLNGDGSIGGYVARDQLNAPRAIQSCIGAVEYSENESQAVISPAADKTFSYDSSIYSLSGQYLGEDITALPKGVYILNGQKIIR